MGHSLLKKFNFKACGASVLGNALDVWKKMEEGQFCGYSRLNDLSTKRALPTLPTHDHPHTLAHLALSAALFHLNDPGLSHRISQGFMYNFFNII